MSPSTHVRREVNSLAPGDTTLDAYAHAVGVMQARHASDPTSWTFQAAIHGTLVNHPRAGQNQCQHATWFFVSWHRMFVYYFERIVRAAVVAGGGSADWALPYWNYELGGAGAAIPPAFRTPTRGGHSNPLFVSQRAPGINAGHALPPQVTTSSQALSRPSFRGRAEFGGGRTPVLFQHFNGPTGQLENLPHNAVHGQVGGASGWMNDPDQAAQDPIFWLHHTNIDRLWAVWVRSGHANPTDPTWLNHAFSFFDEHGQQVSHRAADALDTIGDLHYTYDQFVNQPQPPTPSASSSSSFRSEMSEALDREPELVGTAVAEVQLSGATTSVEVPLNQQAVHDASAAAEGPSRVMLEADNIRADGRPGAVYAVYVNLPAGASDEHAAAHHVGTLSFFGIQRALEPRADEQPHGLSATFDLSELAADERAAGQWNDQSVTVTFVPLGLIAPDGEAPAESEPGPPVTIGSLSLYYA